MQVCAIEKIKDYDRLLVTIIVVHAEISEKAVYAINETTYICGAESLAHMRRKIK
jgi:hypothetical protein